MGAYLQVRPDSRKEITYFLVEKELKRIKDYSPTTRPKERICNPLRCMKSVSVRPSTGESSSDAKSVT